mmetsp:Transcript_159270/g.511002  ORF Transcript_159270/g.511002 Transcript_159270/m.511002 type:complete len:235 (+) Transcript_159270:1147-1851(+)
MRARVATWPRCCWSCQRAAGSTSAPEAEARRTGRLRKHRRRPTRVSARRTRSHSWRPCSRRARHPGSGIRRRLQARQCHHARGMASWPSASVGTGSGLGPHRRSCLWPAACPGSPARARPPCGGRAAASGRGPCRATSSRARPRYHRHHASSARRQPRWPVPWRLNRRRQRPRPRRCDRGRRPWTGQCRWHRRARPGPEARSSPGAPRSCGGWSSGSSRSPARAWWCHRPCSGS